jgi:hypothetical protein
LAYWYAGVEKDAQTEPRLDAESTSDFSTPADPAIIARSQARSGITYKGRNFIVETLPDLPIQSIDPRAMVPSPI